MVKIPVGAHWGINPNQKKNKAPLFIYVIISLLLYINNIYETLETHIFFIQDKNHFFTQRNNA